MSQPTDSERMDWLEKIGVDIRWTELDTFDQPHWTIRQTVGHPPPVFGTGSTLREAIDTAMGWNYWQDHCPSCGASTPNCNEKRCAKCEPGAPGEES